MLNLLDTLLIIPSFKVLLEVFTLSFCGSKSTSTFLQLIFTYCDGIYSHYIYSIMKYQYTHAICYEYSA